MTLILNTDVLAQAGGIYTCPMHPEVQQDHPGACPKCGMALELKAGATTTPDNSNAALLDMTRRFSVGSVLTVPVFVLAMAHVIPALSPSTIWH